MKKFFLLFLSAMASSAHAIQVDVHDFRSGADFPNVQLFDLVRRAARAGVVPCSDSDGFNPQVAGSYSVERQRPVKELLSGPERCEGNSVIEFVCFEDARIYSHASGRTYDPYVDGYSNFAAQIRMDCERLGTGYTCSNGACVAPETTPEAPTIVGVGRLPEKFAGAPTFYDASSNSFYVLSGYLYKVDLNAPAERAITRYPEQLSRRITSAGVAYDASNRTAYFFGGYSEDRTRISDISVLRLNNPAGRTLTENIASLDVNASGIGAAWDSVQRKALLVGGITELGRPMRSLRTYDPAAAPGSQVTVLPELPETAMASRQVAYDSNSRKFFITPAYQGRVMSVDLSGPIGSRLDVAAAVLPKAADYMWLSNPAPGKIWLGGGLLPGGGGNSSIYEIDTSTRVVSERAVPSRLVSNATAAVDSTRTTYVFGGIVSSDAVTEIQRYPYSGTAERLGALKSGEAVGGKAFYIESLGQYIVFGKDGAIEAVDPHQSLERFTRITSDVVPGLLNGFAATQDINRNLIYLFGGRGPAGGVSDIFIYNPSAREGSRITRAVDTLPYPMSWSSAAMVDGKILLAGGVTNSHPSRTLMVYDPNLPAGGRINILPVMLPTSSSSVAIAAAPGDYRAVITGMSLQMISMVDMRAAGGPSITTIGTAPELIMGGAGMIYSRYRNRPEIWGWATYYGSQIYRDTTFYWDWRSSSMVQQDVVLPEALNYAAVAENPNTGETLIAGGQSGSASLDSIYLIH